MSGSTSKRYPVELRERAVRMVTEIRTEHQSEWAAMGQVARLLGIGTPETVRKWCRQAEVDAGQRPGVTAEDSAELKRLKRENAELKRANAILKAAPAAGSRSPAPAAGCASSAPATRPTRPSSRRDARRSRHRPAATSGAGKTRRCRSPSRSG